MAYCRWCHGRGCVACPPDDPEKHGLLFDADVSNPRDMELLVQFFGREAIDHAFGPDGRGMDEIKAAASEVTIWQAVDRMNKAIDREGAK